MCQKNLKQLILFIIVLFGSFLSAKEPQVQPDDSAVTESASLSVPEMVVDSISVIVNNFYGHREYWQYMARSLIFLHSEKPFSQEKLKESIDALNICKRFKTIAVDSTIINGRINLAFTVEPYFIIRKIIVRGAFPLFKSEILKATSLHTGYVFDEEILAEQAEYIREFLQREGYINAFVFMEPEINTDEGYVDLTIRMDKNKPFTLQNITIEGNKGVWKFRLLMRMRTWRKRLIPLQTWRFAEKQVKEDIKSLTKFYHERKAIRFPDCTIEYEADIDSMVNSVDLHIKINEGQHVDIDLPKRKFRGKRKGRRKLRKEIVVYKKGNKNDSGLKKSLRNIKKLYQSDGYSKPEIDYTETISEKRRRTKREIAITINRGPRTLVKSLHIEGNSVFDLKKINKQMVTQEKKPYIRDTLEKDLLSIQTLYRQHGYLFTTIDTVVTISQNLENASVKLRINEERRTTVSSITCNGLSVLPRKVIDDASILKAGDAFQRSLMKVDANTISSLISEKGYPYVTVRGVLDFNSDSTRVGIVYNIDEGKQVYMGNIFYTGDFHTKQYIIRKELGIKSGEPFSLSEVLEAQKEIRDFRIFNSVSYKTIGLKEREDRVQLFVEVEEKKRYFFETGVGFEGGLVWGEFLIGDHNFLGYNRDISFGMRGDINKGYRFNLRMLQPHLFGFKTSLITDVFIKRDIVPDVYGVESYGISLGFTKKFQEKLTGNLGTTYERRDPSILPNADPNEVDKIPRSELNPRNLIAASPSITWDTRNSFVRPTKGYFSVIDYQISHGLDDELDDLMKYEFELRTYLSILPRTTLAMAGRLGYITPFGPNQTVPTDQLFYLGGTRDVRGFENKKLPDNDSRRSSLSGSVEARTELMFNFELATFFDAGRLAKNFKIREFNEFGSSFGLGLRYLTPIGPIGLLYGRQINESRDGKFHFSLGYTF